MIRTIVWPDGFIQLGIDKDSAEVFKQLIRRALNTYVDAHPELKELGDILDHGKVLQDYYSQRTDKPAQPTSSIKGNWEEIRTDANGRKYIHQIEFDDKQPPVSTSGYISTR